MCSATSNHDPWNGLASLMTLLETVVDANKDYLVLEREEGGLKTIFNFYFINVRNAREVYGRHIN